MGNIKNNERKFKCETCGKYEKVYRVFDIDGTNLEEFLVCLNCNSGHPAIL